MLPEARSHRPAFLGELRRRKVYRTAAAYAAGAFVLWQVTDIAFPALGLPDTAMRGVVLLAIAGFPVAVALAWVFEVLPQTRADAIQVAPVVETGAVPPSLLRRPLRIATVAIALLGFGGMAVAVAPASVMPFPQGDHLILADLENHTGDTIFDGVLTQALRIGLVQSSHMTIVPPGEVRAALQAMQRDTASALDAATASEVALRSSVAAVLIPSIRRSGRRYRLETRIVDPENGATVVARTAMAADQNDVLAALDQLARQLRADLGEPLRSLVRRRVPLERATTHSLDALRAWTQGNLHYRYGQVEEARLLWDRAVELDSAFVLAHAALGQFYYWNRGDSQRGEQHFAIALRHRDRVTDRERLMIEAKAAEWRGERETAISAYRVMLGLYPDDPNAWGNLAYQYLRLERHREAMDAYGRVIALDSLNSIAWLNLATLHNTRREHARAQELYERAFSLAPAHLTNGNINHEYGQNLIALGRTDEAEQIHSLMLAQAPASRAQGLRSIALLRFREGRFRAAESLLRQAISVNQATGANVSELRNRGYLIESHVRRNASVTPELDRAERVALERTVGSPWVQHTAVWLARAGRVAGAEVLLDTARARADQDVITHAGLARLEGEIGLARGDTARAVERFQAALALYSDWILPLSALAGIAYARRDMESAESFLTRIIERQTSVSADETLVPWVLAHFQLARVHDERGRTEQALDLYRRFLEFWSGADADVREVTLARQRLPELSR